MNLWKVMTSNVMVWTKKLPTQSRMLPPLNELSYFSFVCRLLELLFSLLLIYVLVHVYYVQYIQSFGCYVFCAAGNKLFKIHYFYWWMGHFNRFKFTSCSIVILLPILFLVILLVLMLSLSFLLLMSGSVHRTHGPNSINTINLFNRSF